MRRPVLDKEDVEFPVQTLNFAKNTIFMTTSAAPGVQPVSVKSPPKISWDAFQRKYLSREDRYKYEWVNGQVEKLVEKMNDYWAAGVKVIWQIYPGNKQIHVYHGKQMTVCTGDDLCSAEPVVEGFVLAVREVFK